MLPHPPFPLPPEATRVILGGGSAIDLDRMGLRTRDEAMAFAESYGYDLDQPAQRHHVERVYRDALAFLEEVILEGTGLELPDVFLDHRNPVDLLLWASERPQDARGRWSCALLRVMHTLFHIDHHVNLRYLPEIQKQVFEPYERHLVEDERGLRLKGVYEVPLVAVERKQNKDRVSMLLKLLQKPENVAETIYDQIGIRFVAPDELGALLVIRFLLDHHVVLPAHVKPSRSRNLMIDSEALQDWMAQIPERFQLMDMSQADRDGLCERLSLKDRDSANPHSSQDYNAIQFTSRTLVRLPSPTVAALEEVARRLGTAGQEALVSDLEIQQLIRDQEEFTFFFAHEVQIMEHNGFQSSQSGPASHAEYKLRQREAARRRVLHGLV